MRKNTGCGTNRSPAPGVPKSCASAWNAAMRSRCCPMTPNGTSWFCWNSSGSERWSFRGGPWLLEIVAGIIDHPGETTEDVARRETTEEAGCELLDLIPICHYLVSPGGTSESITLFCGRVDASTVTPGVRGVACEHEDIRVHVVSRAEALDLLHSGRINSAAPIIALQWLELNRTKLLARWEITPA